MVMTQTSGSRVYLCACVRVLACMHVRAYVYTCVIVFQGRKQIIISDCYFYGKW